MAEPVNYQADPSLCVRCGLCVKDCPAAILRLPPVGAAEMVPDGNDKCYRCQHCLAICPPGAVSILGHRAIASIALTTSHLPEASKVATLMRGRRSVRHYKDENISQHVMDDLLNVASAAPTGRAQRSVQFTVIDDKAKLAAFRERIIARIADLAAKGALPGNRQYFAGIAKAWLDEKKDILFRGAPHFIVASVPKDTACPMQDCVIALSYFELYAAASGLATVWDGMCYWVLTEIVPEAKQWLGIPDEHMIGYCMAFGLPKTKYARTVVHPTHNVVRVG